MEQAVIYLITALLATCAGSVTGMGGGVIIKPVLDLLGHYDVSAINVLSSLTVLSMALVSVAGRIRGKAKFDFNTSLPLAFGSVAGGKAGAMLLSRVLLLTGASRAATAVQNAVLALLIAVAFFYMIKKDKLPSLGLSGKLAAFLAGLLLGTLSSFLGIGGGPINVAVIIFLFSKSTKDAATASLIIILFAQLSSALGTLLAGGYAGHDLSILPVMIAGAAAGGIAGSKLNTRFGERQVEIMFNAVQIIVLCLCVVNIIKNI